MPKVAYRRIFYTLQFIRLFAPLLIFVNVFLGIVAATFFDLIDAMFASRGGMRRHQYHSWDKTLDNYWYVISLIFALLVPEYSNYLELLIILFAYRLLGLLFFFILKKRQIFLFFPNIYENLFILVSLGLFIPGLNFILLTPWFESIILATSVLKLWQEYLLHYLTYPMAKKINLDMRWVD